jgi:hypothetical protein
MAWKCPVYEALVCVISEGHRLLPEFSRIVAEYASSAEFAVSVPSLAPHDGEQNLWVTTLRELRSREIVTDEVLVDLIVHHRRTAPTWFVSRASSAWSDRILVFHDRARDRRIRIECRYLASDPILLHTPQIIEQSICGSYKIVDEFDVPGQPDLTIPSFMTWCPYHEDIGSFQTWIDNVEFPFLHDHQVERPISRLKILTPIVTQIYYRLLYHMLMEIK